MGNFQTLQVLVSLSLLMNARCVSGYCAGMGANPGFSAAPQVQQVSMTSVLVSWNGIVTRKDCADQFLVKSWQYMDPNKYQISELLTTDRTRLVVKELMPQTEYVFQVVAREDKGFLGKDWNKSPPTKFTIRRNNPIVTPPDSVQPVHDRHPVPNVHSGQVSNNAAPEGDGYASGPPAANNQNLESSGNENPVSIVIILFISSTIVIITIIVTGAIYNMIKLAHKKRRRQDSESSSSSSLDLDITSENLVSWRQSRKDLIESTRILAMTSKPSKMSLASSTIDLTMKSVRKVSNSEDLVDSSKSRGASSERRSQGTQTPRSIYVTPGTPCCDCSKSPMLERRRAGGATLCNGSGEPQGQFNTLERSDIDFIDENTSGGGYATVVGRGAGAGPGPGAGPGVGHGLQRISDHTEDEEGSDYEQR